MFDLERAIANWRAGFEGAESFKADDLAEMEGHLRQEFAGLSVGGLKDDERFLIAIRRLGNSADLSEEFYKVNRAAVWRQRFLWMSVGFLGWRIVREFAEILSASFWMFVYWFGSYKRTIPTWQLNPFIFWGLRFLAFLPFLVFGCWLMPRWNSDGFLRGLQSRRNRAKFIGSCLTLVFFERLLQDLYLSDGTNWIRSVQALSPDDVYKLMWIQNLFRLWNQFITPYATILIPMAFILYLAPGPTKLERASAAASVD